MLAVRQDTWFCKIIKEICFAERSCLSIGKMIVSYGILLLKVAPAGRSIPCMNDEALAWPGAYFCFLLEGAAAEQGMSHLSHLSLQSQRNRTAERA